MITILDRYLCVSQAERASSSRDDGVHPFSGRLPRVKYVDLLLKAVEESHYARRHIPSETHYGRARLDFIQLAALTPVVLTLVNHALGKGRVERHLVRFSDPYSVDRRESREEHAKRQRNVGEFRTQIVRDLRELWLHLSHVSRQQEAKEEAVSIESTAATPTWDITTEGLIDLGQRLSLMFKIPYSEVAPPKDARNCPLRLAGGLRQARTRERTSDTQRRFRLEIFLRRVAGEELASPKSADLVLQRLNLMGLWDSLANLEAVALSHEDTAALEEAQMHLTSIASRNSSESRLLQRIRAKLGEKREIAEAAIDNGFSTARTRSGAPVRNPRLPSSPAYAKGPVVGESCGLKFDPAGRRVFRDFDPEQFTDRCGFLALQAAAIVEGYLLQKVKTTFTPSGLVLDALYFLFAHHGENFSLMEQEDETSLPEGTREQTLATIRQTAKQDKNPHPFTMRKNKTLDGVLHWLETLLHDGGGHELP